MRASSLIARRHGGLKPALARLVVATLRTSADSPSERHGAALLAARVCDEPLCLRVSVPARAAAAASAATCAAWQCYLPRTPSRPQPPAVARVAREAPRAARPVRVSCAGRGVLGRKTLAKKSATQRNV